MIDSTLDPIKDKVVLESVQSFMRKRNVHNGANPMNNIIQENVFRDALYSQIVDRMPTYAVYILSSDFENDTRAQGLFTAITHHSLDPAFIDILLQSLDRRYDADAPRARAAVGALLIDIVTKYISSKMSEIEAKADEADKKKKKEETKIPDDVNELTTPARRAAYLLLKPLMAEVQNACAGLEDHEALLIAGCIAMGGHGSVKKIIALDAPITAEIFNIIKKSDTEAFDNILRESLLLEADKYTKLTTNQKNFIESLKRWVMSTINSLQNTQIICQFLVSAYGSFKPKDTSKYLIQLKDCGPTYTFLHSVTRQLIVNNKD